MTASPHRTRTLIVVSVICVLAVGAAATILYFRNSHEPEEVGQVSPKKGVGTWEFRSAGEGLSRTRVFWYYNWTAEKSASSVPRDVTFVPMAWNASSVTEENLQKAKESGDTLLTFNEPDRKDQANMSVSQAIELWPTLQATGLRLGSPAPASDGATHNGWLDWFMREAKVRGYRVDFIAIHWYGSTFDSTAVNQLRSYLDSVYQRYGLPIWLTEFALISFANHSPDPEHALYPSDEQTAQFITESTAMLEQLPYLEKYAWFGLPTLEGSAGSGLCRKDGTLTAAGLSYRSVG